MSYKSPQEKARDMVKQAEQSKVKMLKVPGKTKFKDEGLLHSVLVDDQYKLLSTHIDEQTRRKICQGEYVDFSKLIPKDKVYVDDDKRMEIVNKNGMSYFVPVSEREGTTISGFYRWEQAFRVYSTIYTEANPGRAKELIQYNHIIFLASGIYAWENVYAYDRDFRLHISEYPDRSWGIILQQAWTLRMVDRLSQRSFQKTNSASNNNPKNKKICFKYNAGRCTYGFSCKFEHKCGICNKFGHGAHNCRKTGNHKKPERESRGEQSDWNGDRRMSNKK